MKAYKIILLFMIQMPVCGVVRAVAPCPTGHSVLANTNPGTFMAPISGLCQIGGYSLITISDELYPIFNGFTIGSTVNVCADGYLPSGNTCVAISQGTCQNGNYNTQSNSSTFMAPVNDACQVGGYTIQTLPDELNPVYGGLLMGATVSLEHNYTTGDCISGYYDLGINANTFTGLTNGACTTNYSKFTGTSRCDRNPDSTCVDIPTPEITLTWNDGVNSPTVNSCFFEETIQIPITPVRPGYKFGGWRVKRTN